MSTEHRIQPIEKAVVHRRENVLWAVAITLLVILALLVYGFVTGLRPA
ncbi:MAG: hypothetical protein OK452_08890 [Thaumarchaeota archaeon]|nr:hypothetical protein [Nitrososphaerota archaeon]